jgi:hypothetical protein
MCVARVLQQVVRRPQHPAEGGQPFSAAGCDAADGQHHCLFGLRRHQWSSKISLANVSVRFHRRPDQDHHFDLFLWSSDRRSKQLWYLKLFIYLCFFLKAESIAEAASCAINSEMDEATNHEVCVLS